VTPRLPRDVDGRRLIQALIRTGFVLDRQSGNHAVLVHSTRPGREVVVPIHPRPLAPGTLAQILRRARVSVDDLADLL